ncbi:MAG: MerR family transcriptional regulator, partial [Bryobacteraceae bacterium]
ARTIRYYISRGLLEGPVQAGRGASYTSEHKRRLEEIREQQSSGKMLADIALSMEGSPSPQPPTPSAWWQYPVSDDVLVWVRADASPWRLKQVRSAVAEMNARLRQADGNEEE